MRFYQPILAIAAICLMPVALAEAGAVFVIETTYDAAGSKSTEQTRISIEGKNVIVDMHQDRSDEGQPDQFIFLGKPGEMMVIDHAEKSYMVMDKDSLKAMSGMMGAAASGADGGKGEPGAMEAMIQEALKDVPEEQRAEIEKMMREQMGAASGGAKKQASPVEYRKTKEREKQQGFASTKYVATQDGAVIRELWVTEWDNIDGGEEARDAFKAMAAFWQEAFGDMAQMTGENPIELFEKVDGFPVVTREMSNVKVDSESVLKSAETADIDADAFKPPAGYALKKMGMGGE